MSTKTTKATKADQLAERAKRTAERATERQARAEAERAKAEKLAAAAEAEAAKQAEREIAEAAKQAEADRVADLLAKATVALGDLIATEAAGLVSSVVAAWRLGEHVGQAGLKARPAAILMMDDDEWLATCEAAKAESKQAQPRHLSKVNDSVNVRKAYATAEAAEQAAREWMATDPASVSLRSFVKGENVNKGKAKGDPMTAKAAAGLFAKACEREGLTEDQAMELIAEAMASIAE